MFVIDFIKSIISDSLKKRLGEHFQERAIEDALGRYLESERRHLINISTEEEIDFGKLQYYILNELKDDLELRFFGNPSERKRARQSIVNKSVYYASANTTLKEDRVRKIVFNCIDIAKQAIEKAIPGSLLYVKSEIISSVGDSEERLKSEILENRRLIQEQNADSLLSYGDLKKAAEEGDYSCVSEKMELALRYMSSKHELAPYYGFKMNANNKLMSYPISADAQDKYPAKMQVVSNSIKIGDKEISAIDTAVLKQSYCHQIPFTMRVTDAKKYLGDFLDPIQDEAKELIGKDIVLSPPEFPKAFPCCVRMDGIIVVPYLLLRTKEILDNGTIVVTNEEQEQAAFYLKLSLSPSSGQYSFSIMPNAPTNKDLLLLCQVFKGLFDGKQYEIVLLENNEIMFSGHLEDDRLVQISEEQIDIYEKAVQVEEFYHVSLKVPDKIPIDDYYLLNKLYILSKGEFREKWGEIEVDLIVSDDLRNRVNGMEDKLIALAYGHNAKFELWDASICIPIVTLLRNTRVEDLPRLKDKIKYFDNGDTIRVHFVADKDLGGERIEIIGEEIKENDILLFDNNLDIK